MVSRDLTGPGIRLTAEELLALRATAAGAGRSRPATRKPGAVAGKPPGTGMDLREIRAFSEGDDARRIDPAATARTGALHVRSFHEDHDDMLVLVADFRPAMLWGTADALRSVAGARALARAGWRAVAEGASVAAVAITAAGTASLPMRSGVPQMVAVTRMFAAEHDVALAGPAAAAPPSLGEALARIRSLAPDGAEVLIATGPDGIAPEDEPALARLARRRRVRLLLPLDPAETAPPPRALPIRRAGESRLARLQPIDTRALAETLRRLDVDLTALAHDAS